MRQLKIYNSITNREGADLLITEASKYQPLYPDEEASLARKIRKGDNKAKDKLIKANLRFVISVAKQYQHRGVPFADLVSEGCLGLIKAAELFDDTYGFKFISYAVWWVRQSIMYAINEQSRTVKLPCNQAQLVIKLDQAMSKFKQKEGRTPTDEELAKLLNVKVQTVKDVLFASNKTSSTDAPLDSSSETTLGSLLVSDNTENDSEDFSKDLNSILNTIKFRAKEKEIFCAYYGIGTTPLLMSQIAQKYNLTKERVRQICVSTVYKLKKNNNIHLLKKYL